MMKRNLNLIEKIHTSTKRDYAGRMMDRKAEAMDVARRFDFDFFDGDRRNGYGGYVYDGRWAGMAKQLVEMYGLNSSSSVLDIGCGKGFLLYEIQNLLPGIRVAGFDISEYSVTNAKEEVKTFLFTHNAKEKLPSEDNEFTLAISLNTLHNLKIFDLKNSLQEMERVAENSYLVVESYRNNEELFNLQCWALTCECFFQPDEWQWIFDEFGYTGDYEHIYFE